MENADLKGVLFEQPAQIQINKALKDKCVKIVRINGLFSSSKSFAISGAVISGIHLIVADTKEQAQMFANDLYVLLGDDDVFYLPTSKGTVSRISSINDSSHKVQRTAAINALNSFIDGSSKSSYIVLVTYPAAIHEKIMNKVELDNSIFKIRKGDKLSHDFIKETLAEYGFNRVDFVGEPGEYAVRGGIIDLFSFSDDKPYRLDFFGDEIEVIKQFDINTQRSIKDIDSIDIYPNIYDNDVDTHKNEVFITDFISKTESYIWIDTIDYVKDQIKLMDDVAKSNSSSLFEDFYKNKLIIIGEIDYDKDVQGYNTEEVIFNVSPQPSFNKNFNLLESDLKRRIDEGYSIYISSDNPKQFERLRSIFAHNEQDDLSKVPRFAELRYALSGGFIDNKAKVCVYTDHQIFDRYHKIKIKREVARSEKLTLNELSAFQIGDYVVHIDHGVGVFGGLVKTNLNGKVQEAIKLIYKDNDVIFVSIHGIHRISRFKSKDGTPPKIYKLGNGAWEKLKTQTKSKVKDIARDLIKLYAERRQAKGFAFSADTYMQNELEASFIYEDTPDQLKTTQAVKEDMEKDCPMDRLVCGDVGFGKTEIAVRAAFKAVADSKQVAVLVPTTILALQHYKTFLKRLKDFPCKVEYLSRLKSAKEIQAISDELANGKIDIIIGTHRLLNKEIKFKDLGLLIIDEEQKFGVAAKEKLRQMKMSIDTLTLTATPIPRTLQFSLLGARDLSIINTPPPNRLPVQTEIIDFDEDLIREIITSEIERGGQVFFVHNKVEDILAIEDIIKRICPGVKTAVGHGKMEPKELESIVLDFMAGDYDVLVATTIVENGIDVPNANTIIINQAQNFGLSDLHQLRGRVGRSNQKAYCYLIVPPMVSISDDARRRLRAIEAFSDLGSGFNIAMQDLDIRGAGNLLGGEQSGFIADMGFETYQRILEEAFMELKQEEYLKSGGEESDLSGRKELKKARKIDLTRGEKNSEEFEEAVEKTKLADQYITDCTIDTDLELLIPDNYISQVSEKIRLYKELDTLLREDDLKKFEENLIDRFGELPYQLRQLMFVVRLRREAIKLGFERIILKNNKMLVYFVHDSRSPYYASPVFEGILSVVSSGFNAFVLKEQNNKLMMTANEVGNVEMAYNIVLQLKEKLQKQNFVRWN